MFKLLKLAGSTVAKEVPVMERVLPKTTQLEKLQGVIGQELSGVKNGIAITKPYSMPWNENVVGTNFYRVTQNGDNYAVELLKHKEVSKKLNYFPLQMESTGIYFTPAKNARFTIQKRDAFPTLEGNRIFTTTRQYNQNHELLRKENVVANHLKDAYSPRAVDTRCYDYINNSYYRELDPMGTLGNGTTRGCEYGFIKNNGEVEIDKRFFH